MAASSTPLRPIGLWNWRPLVVGRCRSYPKSDNRPREGAFAKLAILRRDLTSAEREAIG
jgi:hypothetical protein